MSATKSTCDAGERKLTDQSYLNATLGSLTEATWGWDVAWRRFLSVSIGITAAWIFAYRESKAACHTIDSSASVILESTRNTTDLCAVDHYRWGHLL